MSMQQRIADRFATLPVDRGLWSNLLALAALDVMSDPTPEMIAAGEAYLDSAAAQTMSPMQNAIETWKAMCAAAKPPKDAP